MVRKVEEAEQRSRREGAQDDLEPQALGQGDERDHKNHRRAHTDLGARVLQAKQVLLDARHMLGRADDEEGHEQQAREDAEQHSGRSGPALAREEEGQQDYGAEVRDRGRAEDQLAELRAELSGVGQHGDDHSERGRREDDRYQQRCGDQPGQVQPEANGGCDREGDEPAQRRQTQEAPAQPAEVDLETRQEQQKCEPDQG